MRLCDLVLRLYWCDLVGGRAVCRTWLLFLIMLLNNA